MPSDPARIEHLRELSEAGAVLGEWLAHAGDHQDDVPAETWRRIAEAAARVLAAATVIGRISALGRFR